jgi:hypothetical protein
MYRRDLNSKYNGTVDREHGTPVQKQRVSISFVLGTSVASKVSEGSQQQNPQA